MSLAATWTAFSVCVCVWIFSIYFQLIGSRESETKTKNIKFLFFFSFERSFSKRYFQMRNIMTWKRRHKHSDKTRERKKLIRWNLTLSTQDLDWTNIVIGSKYWDLWKCLIHVIQRRYFQSLIDVTVMLYTSGNSLPEVVY